MSMKSKAYKLNKGFIIQEIENETVIFDGENSVLFSFNETASFIFRRLKKRQEPEKIAHQLAKTYEVSEATAFKDVNSLIGKLAKKDIIK